MQDISIDIENFGAEDIMQIQWGKIQKKIREYISNQLKEDQEGEQLTLDFEDPFKGK